MTGRYFLAHEAPLLARHGLALAVGAFVEFAAGRFRVVAVPSQRGHARPTRNGKTPVDWADQCAADVVHVGRPEGAREAAMFDLLASVSGGRPAVELWSMFDTPWGLLRVVPEILEGKPGRKSR